MTTPAEKVIPVAYTAICKRVGRWWEITVPELESGGVTQARTLDEVPATVADLVALMTGANPADVEVEVKAHAGPGLDRDGLLRLGGLAAVAAVLVAVARRWVRIS